MKNIKTSKPVKTKTKVNKLRNKTLLFIIVLAVTPVLLLGGLSLYLVYLSHSQEVSNLELQMLGQKIEEIEKFFAGTLGVLEIRVGFFQTTIIEAADQDFLLQGLLQDNSTFQEVSFINSTGTETAKKARRQGKIELLDVFQLPKFKQAIRGNHFIGDVYYTLSGPAVTLSAPVRNRDGKIIQVVSAEVNLSQIANLIQNARLGSSGYLALIDKDGSLIAGPEQQDILVEPGNNFIDSGRIQKILQGKTLDGLSKQDRYQSFISGLPVVGAGRQAPEIGWGLLVEWPIEDADAIVNDVREQVIMFTLFAALAVLALTPFFANRLVKPIKELKAGVQQIEKGNFEKQVNVKTKDEMEELGAAFNKMAKGLKRLQELKNEFVFIAAHELRAPVTVIRGYLSMIKSGEAGPVSKQIKEILEPVEKSGDGLNQLVEDLLQVARSESDVIEIKAEPMDIRESVKSVFSQLKVLSDQKAIKLVYQPEESLPKVMAAPDRVKEIVKNLVDNAVKYTLKASSVVVSHQIKGEMLLTSVQDTGMGIPKKHQPKIFEKFFRAKTKETQDIQGTGLGLWLIKQMIEKMNGKIWFESKEGKGSAFTFSLPIVRI